MNSFDVTLEQHLNRGQLLLMVYKKFGIEVMCDRLDRYDKAFALAAKEVLLGHQLFHRCGEELPDDMKIYLAAREF